MASPAEGTVVRRIPADSLMTQDPRRATLSLAGWMSVPDQDWRFTSGFDRLPIKVGFGFQSLLKLPSADAFALCSPPKRFTAGFGSRGLETAVVGFTATGLHRARRAVWAGPRPLTATTARRLAGQRLT